MRTFIMTSGSGLPLLKDMLASMDAWTGAVKVRVTDRASIWQNSVGPHVPLERAEMPGLAFILTSLAFNVTVILLFVLSV